MNRWGWIMTFILLVAGSARALASQGGTGTGSGAYNTGGVMGSSSGSTGATYGGTGGGTAGSSTAPGAPAGTATAGGTVGASGLGAQPRTQMTPTSLPDIQGGTSIFGRGGAETLGVPLSPTPSPSPLFSTPQPGGLFR